MHQGTKIRVEPRLACHTCEARPILLVLFRKTRRRDNSQRRKEAEYDCNRFQLFLPMTSAPGLFFPKHPFGMPEECFLEGVRVVSWQFECRQGRKSDLLKVFTKLLAGDFQP